MLKNSLHLTWKLTRSHWSIYLLAGVYCALMIYGEDQLTDPSAANDGLRWVWQLGLGLWDLISSVILFLLLSLVLPRVHRLSHHSFTPQPFNKPYLSTFLAEYLRMLAQVLLYVILFLIPGLIRYIRLIFVPYIVLFAKKYAADEVDALEFSKKLTVGRFWLIFAIVVVTMAAGAGIEVLPNAYSDLHVLSVRIAFDLIGFLISIWTYSVLFLVFERAMLEEAGEK